MSDHVDLNRAVVRGIMAMGINMAQDAVEKALAADAPHYPCPECTSPDSPCVELPRVLALVEAAFTELRERR